MTCLNDIISYTYHKTQNLIILLRRSCLDTKSSGLNVWCMIYLKSPNWCSKIRWNWKLIILRYNDPGLCITPTSRYSNFISVKFVKFFIQFSNPLLDSILRSSIQSTPSCTNCLKPILILRSQLRLRLSRGLSFKNTA